LEQIVQKAPITKNRICEFYLNDIVQRNVVIKIHVR